MDFNKQRFLSYARYDLCINKVFYRNLSLITLFGTIGIMLLALLIKSIVFIEHGVNESSGPNDAFQNANIAFGTMMFYGLLAFYTIMMCIFSGCWGHNLRSKQSRITELTLPASNLEKYVWHTGISVIGGALVCIASLLATEIVHFIISAIFFTGLSMDSFMFHGLASLINEVLDSWDLETVNKLPAEFHYKWLAGGFILYFFCYYLAEFCTFIFGNSVIYKWNIIITYIAMQILSTILSWSIFGIIYQIDWEGLARETTPADFLHFVDNAIIGLYAFSIVTLLWAGFLWWMGYRFFKKAQLCNSLNK